MNPKKRRQYPEHELQMSICTLMDLLKLPYFFIPNGAHFESMFTRIKVKKMGLKAGVPDLFVFRPFYKERIYDDNIPHPFPSSRIYCGLFIEVKSPTRKAVPDEGKQSDMHKRIRAEGYDVVTVNNLDDAQLELTKRYLPNQYKLLKRY